MRVVFWLLPLFSGVATAQQYYVPSTEASIDWNNDTPLNYYDSVDSTAPATPVHGATPDTSQSAFPLRPAIGEAPAVVPAPGAGFGPLIPNSTPVPQLRPALPDPLTSTINAIHTNLTNLQNEAGKAQKQIEKNILEFQKGVIIPISANFEKKLNKLFTLMKHPPKHPRQNSRHERNFCYWSVRTMLERAGFAPPGKLTTPFARDAGDNLLAIGFKKIPWVKNPAQAPPGAVLVYGRGPGHAEIVDADGTYVHFTRTRKWGGNQRIFKAAYFPPGAVVKPPGSDKT